MSGLGLGQLAAHGFAKLTGAQRAAGATSPVAATASGSVVLPDGTEMMGSASATAGGVLSGTYPNPGFAVDMATKAELNAVAAAKQDALVSGTSIKTLNGTPLLGSGDIVVVAESPSPYEVGDLLLTTRTLTAPEWLPADGAIYSQASYAALYAEVGLLTTQNKSTSSSITLPSTQSWTGVAAQGANVVMVGGTGTAAASSTDNGATWTARTMPTSASWVGAAFGGTGLVVAISTGTAAAYSSDSGATWSASTLPAPTSAWDAILYIAGVWVLVPGSGTSYATSTDGSTWTPRTFPVAPTHYWYAATAANGYAVLCPGNNNGWVLVSTNGTTWTQRTTPNTPTHWVGAAVLATGRICVYPYSQALFYTSDDGGATWGAVTVSAAFPTTKMVTAVSADEVVALVVGSVTYYRIVGSTVYTFPFAGSVTGKFVALANSHFVVSQSVSSANGFRIARYNFDQATQFAVPTVPTPTGVTAFIKT